MRTTAVLLAGAVLSLALFFHETRFERECLAYESNWPADGVTCVEQGGWRSR